MGPLVFKGFGIMESPIAAKDVLTLVVSSQCCKFLFDDFAAHKLLLC